MSRSSLAKVLVLVLGITALAAALTLGTGTVVLADAPAAMKAQDGAPTAEFPPHAEVEFERSVIRIPVRLSGDTKPREIVELTAFMRLERDKPVRNTIGYRQFEFTIKDWELFGYSEVLGGHISFAASKDVVQPKSLAVALQKDSDYPALIVYNAIYDIYLDGRKIISQRPGVAMARGVMEIPPRNITVAFQKPFAVRTRDAIGQSTGKLVDSNRIVAESEEDCPGCTIFDPGTCEDMSTITREEFNAGLQEARAIREELATLRPKSAKKVGSRR